MTRLLATVLAAALALPARSEQAPQPPAGDPPRVLAGGQELVLAVGEPVTVPTEGGLYLSPPAWTYQVNLRRWYELELRICKDQVETAPPGGWKPWAVGVAAGLALGVVAGVLAVRAAR